ncbi:hypothetical protein GQ457_17G015090 [Hibiscus cannabinus]
MGIIGKAVHAILLLAFFFIVAIAPLDVQIFLPDSIVPDLVKPLYRWYTTTTGDYLMLEKPHFFRALMMVELFLLFPLALLNTYGLLTSKPWFNSTCLIFGASLLTATAAMLGDILGSDKPSADLMVKLYSPLLALGSLAILRGLVPQSSTTAPNVVNGPTSTLKKRT